ncbi:MAG: hypothetical protein ACI92E_001995 [Oceanicoccus sp.]|jgi:hypothetical protein
MIDTTVAAYLFCAFTAVIVVFQLALALGAPWGELAMAGKYPGRFPAKMRIAALVQTVLLSVLALIVLVRAELVLGEFIELSRSAVWFVVVIYVVSAILNTITPSKKERMIWAPFAIVQLICSLIVATS